jgi:hypothetical protein
VIGHAVLLEEEAQESANDALVDRAERIRLAAERCGQTVSTFLSMARHRGIRRDAVKPGALLRSVLDLLDDDPSSGDMELSCELPSGLPPILGDADQLRHVLANLIANARQALQEAAPPRQMRVTAAAAGRCDCCDRQWPGYPGDLTIFDRFHHQAGADGIGLRSRGIAEAHGGNDLEPSVARGAHFVLRLPVAPRSVALFLPSVIPGAVTLTHRSVGRTDEGPARRRPGSTSTRRVQQRRGGGRHATLRGKVGRADCRQLGRERSSQLRRLSHTSTRTSHRPHA